MIRTLTTCLILALLALLLIAAPRGQIQAQEPTPYQGAWHGYIMLKFTPSPLWPSGVDQLVEKALRESAERLIPARGAWPPYNLQIGPWNLTRTAVIVEGRFDVAPGRFMLVDLLSSRLRASRLLVDSGIEIVIFAEGGTYEESQQAITDYMAQTIREWQEPDTDQIR